MKKHTSPLQPETYYHIYNRGNNKETIFKEEKNYNYFLKSFAKYIEPIANTYAYCLLGNHFHFLIRIKSEEEIIQNLCINIKEANAIDFDVSKKLSNQFAKLFNSYTQAINKGYSRKGGLFEDLFRRIPVEEDHYISRLIVYIHRNPEKHGFVDDFRDYKHSSYHSHLLNSKTHLKREEVIDWFGGKREYKEFHENFEEDQKFSKYVVEYQ